MKYRVKKGRFVLFTALLVFLGAFSFFQHTKKRDDAAYLNLVQNTQGSEKTFEAKQKRQGVEKHLIFAQKGKTLRLDLLEETSEIVVDKTLGQQEVFEHAKKITGKLYSQASQDLLITFTAEMATFGKGQGILLEGKTTFNFNQTQITCPNGAKVDLQNAQFELFGKDSEQVVYLADSKKLLADRVQGSYSLDHGGLQLETVQMLGSVRFEKTAAIVLQYLVADSAVYKAQDNKLNFFADVKKRVLFFDKMNNLQLSAPAVEFDFGKKNPIATGKGDVRLYFAEEELAEINQAFKAMGR